MASEFDIIARHFAPIAGPGGLRLLDDAALVDTPPGHQLVVTTDAVVAGVHFFADDPADTIAQKALGVNLSDLAAKGADPLGFVLSLIMPKETSEAWLAGFASGLRSLSAAAACPLLGGDTVISKSPMTLSITAFGSVPAGQMVRRDGAQAGDRLFVTGTIGDAAIGLKARLDSRGGSPWPLAEDHLGFLDQRYLVPRPRFAIASVLRSHAHAAMDISDGFVGDLSKMIALAGMGADIRLDDVPHSVAARAAIRLRPELVETALTGGDDYEVLAAVPATGAKAFAADCLALGLQATEVGFVTGDGAPIRFLEADGKVRSFARGSYVHGESLSP
jgi:thiamine-monophosphate kinase